MALDYIADKIRIKCRQSGDQNGYRNNRVADVIRYLNITTDEVEDTWEIEPVSYAATAAEMEVLRKEVKYLKTRCCRTCRDAMCDAGADGSWPCVVRTALEVLGNPEM